MKVILVKRGKIIHAGLKIQTNDILGEVIKIISICNNSWYANDTTSIGEHTEVTCKRCQKKCEEAVKNNGIVTFKGKNKRRNRNENSES